MKEQTKPVSLTILGKEYKVACTPSERADLLYTAQMLDERMREIQDSGKVIGSDRIAVMVALNFAHELNQLKKQNSTLSQSLTEHLKHLRRKIESVLEIA